DGPRPWPDRASVAAPRGAVRPRVRRPGGRRTMWKRENETAAPASTPTATPPPAGAPSAAPNPMRVDGDARPAGSSERAVLSPSIVLRGEVSGDEDLLVEGRVDRKSTRLNSSHVKISY